jgi:hypothetical protein
MIAIEKNIFVVGGVGLEGTNKDQLLRDMWLLNLEELDWLRVDPANGILRGFSDSSLCLHNNKVYVIGGLVERLDTWNEQVSIIEFGEDEIIRNEICSNCQLRVAAREKEEKAFPKTVVVTVGFFYTASLEIRHPFQALLALHRCAAFLEAGSLRLTMAKGYKDNEYLDFQWDGRSLSKAEFEQLICHSSSKDP